MSSSQSTTRVIMVRPACFSFNTETASSNPFQTKITDAARLSPLEIHQQALIEFDRMVSGLRQHGIDVHVLDDTPFPVKPDAIFSDNWITTHADGTIITYPMMSSNRRCERRDDLIENLRANYQIRAIIHLEVNEHRREYLEGTGSVIFDRINRIVYAAKSSRTNVSLVHYLTQLIGYQQPPILFDTRDLEQQPVFHTNILLAIGTFIAIVCLEVIEKDEEKLSIVNALKQNNERTIIEITLEQMNHFAGNALELRNQQGDYFLVMSTTAFKALTEQQISLIQANHTEILHFDVSTIETYGGGSARCIITENFLSPNTCLHSS